MASSLTTSERASHAARQLRTLCGDEVDPHTCLSDEKFIPSDDECDE